MTILEPSSVGATPAIARRREDSSEFIIGRYRARAREISGPHARIPKTREEWRRHHVLHQVPLLRLAACVLLAALIAVFNRFVAPATAGWQSIALLLPAYALLAWGLVVTVWPRWHRVEWSAGLLVIDLLVLGVAIHYTGGNRSWLFFLPLIRVADQAFGSVARTSVFAALAPLTYAGVLWLGTTREPVLWQAEVWKLGLLAAGGLYFVLASAAAASRRGSIAATLHAAHETIADLERQSKELVVARERWRDQASRDPLTGLLNRKGIDDIVERGLQRSRTNGIPFSVIVGDLDRFKQVNDRLGHGTGDLVLQTFALLLLHSGRAFDAVGRTGGDEFLIALQNCDREGAWKLAERIRESTADGAGGGAQPLPRVTVSFGVASAGPGWQGSFSQLVDAADRALLRAKSAGANQTMVAEPL